MRQLNHWDPQLFVRVVRKHFPIGAPFYVSRETGIPQRTVERHLEGFTNPSADALLAYLKSKTLGPELRAAFLPGVYPEE